MLIPGENQSNIEGHKLKKDKSSSETPRDLPLEQQDQLHDPDKSTKYECMEKPVPKFEPSDTPLANLENNEAFKKCSKVSNEGSASEETPIIDQDRGTGACKGNQMQSQTETKGLLNDSIKPNAEEINMVTEMDVTGERPHSFPLDEKSEDGEDQKIPLEDRPIESVELIKDIKLHQGDYESDGNAKESISDLVATRKKDSMLDMKTKLSSPDDHQKAEIKKVEFGNNLDQEVNGKSHLEIDSGTEYQSGTNNNLEEGATSSTEHESKTQTKVSLDDSTHEDDTKLEPASNTKESDFRKGQTLNELGFNSVIGSKSASKTDKVQQKMDIKDSKNEAGFTKKGSATKKIVLKKKQRDEKKVTDEEGQSLKEEGNPKIDDKMDSAEPNSSEENNLDPSSYSEKSEVQINSEQTSERMEEECVFEPKGVDVMEPRSPNLNQHINEPGHFTPEVESENLEPSPTANTMAAENQDITKEAKQRTLLSDFESSQESIQNLLSTFRPHRRHEQLLSTSFITYLEVTSANRNRNMSKLLVPAHPRSYLPVYF